MYEYVHTTTDIMYISAMKNLSTMRSFQYLYDYVYRFLIHYFLLTYTLSYEK